MDFWFADEGLWVYKDMLVALIRDPNNWRPGEIAAIEDIDIEGPDRLAASLEFADGHKHVERFTMSSITPHTIYFGIEPGPQKVGIYYRLPKPINGNSADHAMVRQGRGLTNLVQDFQLIRLDNPNDSRLAHLHLHSLAGQYGEIFKQPFPIQI